MEITKYYKLFSLTNTEMCNDWKSLSGCGVFSGNEMPKVEHSSHPYKTHCEHFQNFTDYYPRIICAVSQT
jgi:hypothetical protein